MGMQKFKAHGQEKRLQIPLVFRLRLISICRSDRNPYPGKRLTAMPALHKFNSTQGLVRER
jgi:hypothetical protein